MFRCDVGLRPQAKMPVTRFWGAKANLQENFPTALENELSGPPWQGQYGPFRACVGIPKEPFKERLTGASLARRRALSLDPTNLMAGFHAV